MARWERPTYRLKSSLPTIIEQIWTILFWMNNADVFWHGDATLMTLLHCSIPCLKAMSSLCSSNWTSGIQWRISFSGKGVVFLDLDISLAQGQFAIQTRRKPQNAYLYNPRTSCYPKSVCTTLIVGETQRLCRNSCQNAGRLRHHIGFFLRRLQLRGFSVAECSQLIEKTLQKLSVRKQKMRQENKVFFRQNYASRLNARWIQHALRWNWHVVQRTLKKPAKPVLLFRVQKNIFCRNWLF